MSGLRKEVEQEVEVVEEEEESPTIRKRIPIVTSCSSGKYFTRLRNLIGSIHYWEPTIQIKLYDLGLSSQELKEAATWMNVEIRSFNFSAYPPHVRQIRNFAWKPIVMKDALQREGHWILYQDAGQELRRSIEEVEGLIEREGYMYVGQDGKNTNLRCCGLIGELTQPGMYEALGVNEADYKDQMMCAGGIQGYRKDSPAVNKVLDAVVACALQAKCIAPTGATLANHRYDQSAFSIVIAREGFTCQKDPKYWANRGNNRTGKHPQGIPQDETEKNNVILFSRRGWGIDYDLASPFKRYDSHIKKK